MITVEAVWPTSSQGKDLLGKLQDGRRYTVKTALQELGIYALSQRCGELRRLGWEVGSHTITLANGKRVKEYYLE